MEGTGHTNLKFDRVRPTDATTTQWLRRRAGGHTASEMDRVGPWGAETNQWLRWGAGTRSGHSRRPHTHTLNAAQGRCH